MAGRKQRGRGGGRGYRGGRGFGRGGGRGGHGDGSRGRGRGRGQGYRYVTMDEIDGDFAVDIAHPQPGDNSRRGAPPPSTRGRQRVGKERWFGVDHERDYSDSLDNSDYYHNSRYSTPMQGASPGPPSSRGNGHQRGRGRGGIAGPDGDLLDVRRKRGFESKLRRENASLSQLLHENRPFLKPITFVRSKTTPTLFLKDEEIFKPVAEATGEQEASHVPTAERVYRIFHGGNAGPQPSDLLSDEEELLEVDYEDLGRFMSEIESAPASKTKEATPAAATATTSITTSIWKDQNQPVVTTAEEPTGSYIDTKPSPVQDSSTSTNVIAVEYPGTGILGEDIGEDDDDEIIVYVAPHPRNSTLTHTQSSPSNVKAFPPPAGSAIVAAPVHQKIDDTPQTQALLPKPEPKLSPEPVPELESESVPKDLVVPAPSLTPAPAPAFKDFSFSKLSDSPKPKHRAQWPRRIARRKAERKTRFGSFGALRAEATLRELDPRRAEQRRGDSDVDWGGSTSGVAEAEDREEDGGMLVDWDIAADAMVAFVRGMGVAGQTHVSAGDLEDEERIRGEDADEEEEEEEEESASNSDEDTELELADDVQGILAAEGEGRDEDEVASTSRNSSAEDDDDGDTSEDEEETPRRSFQARLKRIRGRTAGQPIKDMMQEELDQAPGVDGDLNSDSDSNIDHEDDTIAQIQDFLDENNDIIRSMNRKQRRSVFRAVHNGKFEVGPDDFIDSSPKRKKDKYVPAELHDQWERDRETKAERKRLRELERIAAAGPFTPTKKKKGGKKARKARLAAAPISIETVVEQMRNFVADLGSARTLSLPPMTRQVRKSVHEIAHAFNLKSKSEGTGEARFTTLLKTTLSGVQVDERKVARILGKPLAPAIAAYGKGKGKAVVSKIRPRDGEVVGGAAPKIDGSNVGFQMLSAMGWAEGSQIGAAGGVGLDVPLLAVIKTTKLGLGASSHRS